MQINVSQQLKSATGTKRYYQVSEVVDIAGSSSPVKGEVDLIRTDCSILVQGRLHIEVELTCSRCVSLLSCPLTLNFEEEYFPTADVVTGASLSLPNEPGSFTIDERNILDLTEAVRQYALMAIPMKPLCQKNCAGICPTCGYNLNQAPCNCPPRPVDPRWSGLLDVALADSEVSAHEQKGME